MNTHDWTFATLADLWEYRNGAILAGGDTIDSLTDEERDASLADLEVRVQAMVGPLDDSWLMMTGFWMVEDIYKSFFRRFAWTPGVHDYLAVTARPVIAEFDRRSMVLNYVIDCTQEPANLATMLAYLPAVFEAAGLDVVGPQMIAAHLFGEREGRALTDVTEIQRHRDDGHALADQVVTQWHRERRSCVYLNADLDDGTPGLPLDVAISQRGCPSTVLIVRTDPPTEGSLAHLFPPPGVTVPAAGDPADRTPRP